MPDEPSMERGGRLLYMLNAVGGTPGAGGVVMNNSSMAVVAIVCSMACTMPAASDTFRLLYQFHGGSDSAHADGPLTRIGGTLYGTTEGTNGIDYGTVFALSGPAKRAHHVVYRFTGGKDGSDPTGKLIELGGSLYGTTLYGGSSNCPGGCGTLYSLDPATGAKTVLHVFSGANDGANPYGGLTRVGDTLFGTTQSGGAGDGGTLYSVDSTTKQVQTVYGFQPASEGAGPSSDLLALSGELYGTTFGGAASNMGTVFAFDVVTQHVRVVHVFGGADGGSPIGGVIDAGGVLYGTTARGGQWGAGTVFSLDRKTGKEHVIHSFGLGKDGAYPEAALKDFNGLLYGTTEAGGAYSRADACGTVFLINRQARTERIVHHFRCKRAASPVAGLVQDGGVLYGTTAGNDGSVFALTPDGSTATDELGSKPTLAPFSVFP